MQMLPCACCGVMSDVEPFLSLTFATHRGQLCPDCYQVWRDPLRTSAMSETPRYVPVTSRHDPRLWWKSDDPRYQ